MGTEFGKLSHLKSSNSTTTGQEQGKGKSEKGVSSINVWPVIEQINSETYFSGLCLGRNLRNLNKLERNV